MTARIGATALLGLTVLACQSTSHSSSGTGGSGVVSDSAAMRSSTCTKGTPFQVAACRLGSLDGAVSPGALDEYPVLLRQAALTCSSDGPTVADQVVAAGEQEKTHGAAHVDSNETLLHIVINDGPAGSNGCAGTLAVHVMAVIPG